MFRFAIERGMVLSVGLLLVCLLGGGLGALLGCEDDGGCSTCDASCPPSGDCGAARADCPSGPTPDAAPPVDVPGDVPGDTPDTAAPAECLMGQVQCASGEEDVYGLCRAEPTVHLL